MKIARDAITGMTAEAEVGKIYRGKVVTIKDFGAFVEFLPGKDGLVHISELANFRVKQTEDIVKLGDEIWVKCLGVDEKGRVRLSRKAAMAERDQQMSGGSPEGGGSGSPEQGSQHQEQGEREHRGDRGGDHRGDRDRDRGPRGDRRGDRGDRGDRRGGDRGGDRGDRGDRSRETSHTS
jgi:polyribonucleotide nucleotidyltransferase